MQTNNRVMKLQNIQEAGGLCSKGTYLVNLKRAGFEISLSKLANSLSKVFLPLRPARSSRDS